MLLFIICCIALVAVVLATLAPALLKHQSLRMVDVEKINLDIAKQRIAEVTAYRSLKNNQAATTAIDDELVATLLDDLKGTNYSLKTNRPAGAASAVMVMLAIPLLATLIYGWLGNFNWLDPQQQLQNPAYTGAASADDNPMAALAVLLNRLEQALADNPQNAQGWRLAAKTYMRIGSYAKAENAFSMAHNLLGPTPDILTAWADATLMANGNNFTAEVDARIAKALELEPKQANALWIAGLSAAARGDQAAAFDYFTRLRPLLAGDAEAVARIDSMRQKFSPGTTLQPVNSRTTNSRRAAATPQSVAQNSPAASGYAKTIKVMLSVDRSIAEWVNDDDLVFVFAKAPSGTPFPLAVVRITVGELPTTIVLDNATAMIPAQNISGVEQVVVSARIAKTGNPVAQSGDLASNTVLTSTDGNPALTLIIDQVIK